MMRRTIQRGLLALAVTLLPISGALASNCSSNPFTLANGQVADATQVMANFNNLLNCANNNLAHNGANSDITSLSALTTPLSVAQGGTGDAALTLNNLMVGAGVGPVTFIAPSTSGNVLTSNGTSWVSALGSIQTLVEGTPGGINIVNSTTKSTLNFKPSDLPVKVTPLSTDSIVIADVATASQGAVANLATAVRAAFPSGVPVQMVMAESGGVASGTTVLPADDTIPQNTEGDQYMTITMTPQNSSSTLIIGVTAMLTNAGGSAQTMALFRDAGANAIAAIECDPVAGSFVLSCVLQHKVTAGSNAPTTFTMRSGNNAGSTTTFNGVGGVRRFGGVAASSIIVTETLP